tara:strand:+ start:7683 stop:8810 length:1128 start_codon:yes stop_codon:yes gene_type:complete
MAYAAPSGSRFGQDQGAGSNTALFLKVFSGEVLTVFEEQNQVLPLVRTRTITSGKSAQFPVTGVAHAKYHTPGESVLVEDAAGDLAGPAKYNTSMTHSERVISIDAVLTSSAFLTDIDEAMNHFDVRSVYSTEIGRELAYTTDENLIGTIIGGARELTDRYGNTESSKVAMLANKFLGGTILCDGGTSDEATANEIGGIGDNDGTVEGSDWVKGIFKMAELMDERNVPQQGRYAILPPAEYYKLIKENTDAINRDFGNEGNGSTASGTIMEVAGVRILKSNHIPQANNGSADIVGASDLIANPQFGSNTGYLQADFSNTIGVGFQSEGVGTVKLMDLAMESEYIMERLGTLLLAKYAMGHGVLREECCYEFSNKT